RGRLRGGVLATRDQALEAPSPAALDVVELLIDAAARELGQLLIRLTLALPPHQFLVLERAPRERAEHRARQHDHGEQQRPHAELVSVGAKRGGSPRRGEQGGLAVRAAAGAYGSNPSSRARPPVRPADRASAARSSARESSSAARSRARGPGRAASL